MTRLSFCTGSERGDIEVSTTKRKIDVEREEYKRKYSCVKNLCNYVTEFCNSGTIHGIRYFGENRTLIEKLWWAISIGVSLYFCINLIVSAYDKWETSPVIVSFATKETPVWMIPFPSVTICPESKTVPSIFNYSKYFQMKENGVRLEPEIEKKFSYLSFICKAKGRFKYKYSEKFVENDIFDFFHEVQPKFSDYATDCRFLNKHYNCSDLFVPIITDDGICYTFNIIDRTQLFSDIVIHHKNFYQTQITDEWDLEQGYHLSAGLNAYPRRALLAGIPNALKIKLIINEDKLDKTCGTAIKGFKVQIAHPQTMPRVKNDYFIVPADGAVNLGITPQIMATSAAIRRYDPNRRNCYLPSESSLKYFKVYSQNNCIIECRANFTLRECGCVPFFFPRENGTRICGTGSYKCLEAATNKILLDGIQKNLDKLNKRKSQHDHIPDCHCLPICTGMYYNVEYYHLNWNWRLLYKHDNRYKFNASDPSTKISSLRVYFKRDQFINSERNELYGPTDFLANVGGLLGLFVGFSALSLIEIVYYLTLRIICNISMYGKGNWAGKED